MIHPATYTKVRQAIDRAFELFPMDLKGKKVLIKPNVLRASEANEGIVTHPEVLRAVVSKVETLEPGVIIVGDNPGVFKFTTPVEYCGKSPHHQIKYLFFITGCTGRKCFKRNQGMVVGELCIIKHPLVGKGHPRGHCYCPLFSLLSQYTRNIWSELITFVLN